MEIRNLKGIGELMAQRIIKEFGSVDEFQLAAQNYEVDRLAKIEGLSQRRAVEIINEVLGNPKEDFLKTKRAFQLYEDIINRILAFANTDYARNRVMLLSPLQDREKILQNLDKVMNAKNKVLELPREEIRNLYKGISPLKEPFTPMNPAKALVVECREDYEKVMERGLNQYYSLLNVEELDSIPQFELVIYAYSDGYLEWDDVPNMAMVPLDSDDFELVPDTVLKFFQANHQTIENCHALRKLLGWESSLDEVIAILDSMETYEVDETQFDQALEDAQEIANQKMKKAIKNVDLSGDEVLDLLNEELPQKIQKILDEVLDEARMQIKASTSCEFNAFIPKYPLEKDQEEIERIKKLEMGRKHLIEFENEVKAAKQLSILSNDIYNEVKEVIEFDYELTLGIFALEYDLNQPILGEGFHFEGALHLDLHGKQNVQKINYNLKDPENVVLLTGANSGGKTTLLETLSQILILTQMGMPVPARYAKVELIEELYFFSKRRSLDAGAFESFLRNFVPVATYETNKLILLDELEAITELEAAVKIISCFMELIQESGSYAVIVTHLAREILKHSQVRVDGIEALGLDEEYNLIVDRTPRINYLARSTPELILRRVYEKSEGKLKDIYGLMLKKF